MAVLEIGWCCTIRRAGGLVRCLSDRQRLKDVVHNRPGKMQQRIFLEAVRRHTAMSRRFGLQQKVNASCHDFLHHPRDGRARTTPIDQRLASSSAHRPSRSSPCASSGTIHPALLWLYLQSTSNLRSRSPASNRPQRNSRCMLISTSVPQWVFFCFVKLIPPVTPCPLAVVELVESAPKHCRRPLTRISGKDCFDHCFEFMVNRHDRVSSEI